MSSGPLLHTYAFEVYPGQSAPFDGGYIKSSQALQNALDQAFVRSRVASAPAVTFIVNTTPKSRSHPIRDAAVAIAFGTGKQMSVATGLAQRLADSMDNRSKPSLLMVSVHQTARAADRRVMLWTFPQQAVFSLRSRKGSDAELDLFDAFNRESSLRKVAMLEGPNTAAAMLSARVLDFQAAGVGGTVADLWIARFLEARLQMGKAEGTLELARALRSAHAKTKDNPLAQDQIMAAIGAIRVSQVTRHSLDEVASTYLGDEAAKAFLGTSTPETRAAVFEIDLESFDRLVQYKRFTLDNGVVVSAPFAELDEDMGVKITKVKGRRRLRVEGTIEGEEVRTRA